MADMGADDGGQTSVAEPGPLGVVVENGTREIEMAADVARCISVSGIDGFIAGAAQRIASQEPFNQTYRGLAIGRPGAAVPVAVPDDVDRYRACFEHGSAVIVDSIALHHRLTDGSRSGQSLAGLAMLAIRRFVFAVAKALGHQEVSGQNDEETNQPKSCFCKRRCHSVPHAF